MRVQKSKRKRRSSTREFKAESVRLVRGGSVDPSDRASPTVRSLRLPFLAVVLLVVCSSSRRLEAGLFQMRQAALFGAGAAYVGYGVGWLALWGYLL